MSPQNVRKRRTRLLRTFFTREDVLTITRELLGKFLFTRLSGELTGGMIVEAEAYAGADDRASHAYGNRRTERTQVMFAGGGVAYVYLCYGLHHLFNVVTNRRGVPHAILIRALEPTVGVETMLRRRHKPRLDHTLCAGPGTTAAAMGITTALSGTSLTGRIIWLEDRGVTVNPNDVITSPRVGVGYAGEHAAWPYRFRIKNSPWVSRAK